MAMRLRLQQAPGDTSQVGLGSEYTLTPNYTIPSSSSAAYPPESQRTLPATITEVAYTGRPYDNVQTSSGPSGYHPDPVQLPASDFASFHQPDSVASDQHTFQSQSNVLNRQSDLPAFSSSMQEQYSSPLYASQGISQMQMMGLPPPRQHPALPATLNPQRPKTESKPLIDPVDNKQLCTFFLRTGTCAYGDKCRFKHPKDRPPPQLNSRGYPIREGETDCAHYLKRGWCAFGVTCKYNHPESTAFVPMPYQQPGFVPVPGMVTVPYIPAYTYPAFTSTGLTSPAMYAPAAYPNPNVGMAFRPTNPMSQMGLAASDANVDKAAQSLEALSLQGPSQK